MHQYSGALQRKIDMHRNCQKIPLTGLDGLGVASCSGMPYLHPVQAHAFADNLQLSMYRDGLFMKQAVVEMDGLDGYNLETWNLLNYAVR